MLYDSSKPSSPPSKATNECALSARGVGRMGEPFITASTRIEARPTGLWHSKRVSKLLVPLP
jgi:hypothetical protein